MKKLILVYNPVSGDASFKYKLDEVIEKFANYDCMIIPYRTRVDNREAFRSFVQNIEDAEGIIISGGDGTVHEVINMLIEYEFNLPIGIIASGTSNDFASYLGISDDLEEYIKAIAQGGTIPIDIGKVGNQYFFNVASAGMLTSVAHQVDARLKNAIGKMAYYLKGLGEIPGFRMLDLQIEADGRKFSEKAILFVIVNSGTVGSMKNIVDARIDDGKLDLMIVKPCSIPEFMALAVDLMAGKNVTKRRNVCYLQAKDIKISSSEPVESDLDGELGPDLPLDITTLQGKMRLFYGEK